MSKFKRSPNTEEYEKFISEPVATKPEKDNKKKIGSSDNSKPWGKENVKSIKRKVFNVRINGYYHEALKYFSNPEIGESMQIVARKIIEEGLDRLIENETTH